MAITYGGMTGYQDYNKKATNVPKTGTQPPKEPDRNDPYSLRRPGAVAAQNYLSNNFQMPLGGQQMTRDQYLMNTFRNNSWQGGAPIPGYTDSLFNQLFPKANIGQRYAGNIQTPQIGNTIPFQDVGATYGMARTTTPYVQPGTIPFQDVGVAPTEGAPLTMASTDITQEGTSPTAPFEQYDKGFADQQPYYQGGDIGVFGNPVQPTEWTDPATGQTYRVEVSARGYGWYPVGFGQLDSPAPAEDTKSGNYDWWNYGGWGGGGGGGGYSSSPVSYSNSNWIDRLLTNWRINRK